MTLTPVTAHPLALRTGPSVPAEGRAGGSCVDPTLAMFFLTKAFVIDLVSELIFCPYYILLLNFNLFIIYIILPYFIGCT